MRYEVIASSSAGNCVVLDNSIVVDMGVPFKALSGVYKQINLVLLTHTHSDHFNKSTIRRLAAERPLLRFGCCEWLTDELLACGVPQTNIDVMQCGKTYNYGTLSVSPVRLYHDVPNCGWRVLKGKEKAIYMTDTCTLKGIRARNYDLYLVECNYSTDEIRQRIRAKRQSGQYVYEYRVMRTHLSREQCDNWLLANMGDGGEYVYLHRHQNAPQRT